MIMMKSILCGRTLYRICSSKRRVVDLSSTLSRICLKTIENNEKIAIYGDYSRYTSKPLKDFIYESNKGKNVFFVSTKEEAISMLTK